MLEVIKTGSTQYGYWVYGVLKYNGLEIKDIFSVNKEVLDTQKTLKPEKIYINRTKNNNLKFKIDL